MVEDAATMAFRVRRVLADAMTIVEQTRREELMPIGAPPATPQGVIDLKSTARVQRQRPGERLPWTALTPAPRPARSRYPMTARSI